MAKTNLSDKLKQILDFATEGMATHDDLLKLTDSIVNVITKERDKIQAKLDKQSSDTDGAIDRTLRALAASEGKLRSIIADLAQSTSNDTAKLQDRLTAEMKRLERKIPKAADLSGLESQIEAIQAALVTVPTEITANPKAVRDALELLSEEERLDIRAIRGLENYAELVELSKTVHPSNFNLGKVIRSIQAGTGISIDNSNPNSPVVSTTGAGTGDMLAAVYDPANGARQVAFADQLGSGGIVRSVVVTSGSATTGSTAGTDYVYMIAGAHTMSLPAASGNTNLYTFKNNHSANVTIDTVGAETIDGTASISIAPEESVNIISDGTNFRIV